MAGRRLFVLRDFELKELPFILADLASRVPDGCADVRVPGIDKEATQQGEVFRDNVERELKDATHALAIVDLPNANVGFEVGYALGLGKPLALATLQAGPPPWIEDSPLRGLLVGTQSDYDTLARQAASDEWIEPLDPPAVGEETLLLCPSDGVGKTFREHALALAAGWRATEDPLPLVKDVREVLDGVGRVVWVVTSHREGEAGRDGRANAGAAVVAGYAYAREVEVVVLRQEDARRVVDVFHREQVFDNLPDFRGLVEKLCAPAAPQARADPLGAYRAWVAGQHRELVPFAPDLRGALLRDTCVEVEVRGMETEGKRADVGPDVVRAGTLESVVRGSRGAGGRGPRWLVVGEPGAGKTTMARDLVRRLALDADGPTPLYVPLARCVEREGDAVDFVEVDLAETLGREGAARVGQTLRARLDTEDGVWILLDGLDEVPPAKADDARRQIQALVDGHEDPTIVVLTRPVAVEERGGLPGFRTAAVQALGPEQQADLLQRLVGEEVALRLREVVAQGPRLGEMARNPFLLTLIALVGKSALAEDRAVPGDRAHLYDEAVGLLLRRGYGLEARPPKDPGLMRAVLAPLSLALHEEGGETWEREQLVEPLWALRRQDEELDFRIQRTWESTDALLEDMGRNSGILGPHDGPREPWRYLHRSLREFLAADALHQGTAEGAKRVLDLWMEARRSARPDRDEASREDRARAESQAESWGEVYSLYCGLCDDPLEPMGQLRDVSAGLAVRTLRTLERVSPEDRVAFLFETDEAWDADDLKLAAATFPDPAAAEAALLERIVPEKSTERLAWIWATLEAIDARTGREDFLQACGRWSNEGMTAELEFVRIPAGVFEMGSRADDAEGSSYERPPHGVAVPAFDLARHPVTVGQWRAFEGAAGRLRPRRSKTKDDDLPVTDVSWWEARLYCAWVGARLPSEAEWEYACRAGTTTRYWSGDEEADLARVGWYDGNSDNRLHAVGEKPANAWGLHDVHGNVWEWCEDMWHPSYQGAPSDGSAWVGEGPGSRVVRGGGWGPTARAARSAYRFGWRPGIRIGALGFRPARSVTS